MDEEEETEDETEENEEEETQDEELPTKESIDSSEGYGIGAMSWILAVIPIIVSLYFAYTNASSGNWGTAILFFGIGISIGSILGTSIGINAEWERAIILRFGKYNRVVSSGLFFKIPFIETLIRRDMRIKTLDIPTQEVITKDNISVRVDAVIFMQIIDAKKTVLNIKDYIFSVAKFGQTSLRNVIGQKSLDDILGKTSEVASAIQKAVDTVADKWGVDIQRVELQNIELPENMKRVIAIQAEAEREARAIQTKAHAELDASSILKKASTTMNNPIAMQLRVLQGISEISKGQANTIIMALPIETLKALGPGGIGALASINSSDARRRVAEKAKK